ncbi:V-type ATPase subunit [Anaerostipes sp.]|nr:MULTISPECIES: V-type ATPase subunit [Anaerostipes]
MTAYLFYKEEEIQRLITIMERVRYGLPPEQTAGYMKGVIGV